MNTKYDVDEIIYLPFVVNRIEIEGTDYNGVEKRILYRLIGRGNMAGAALTISEKDCVLMTPCVRRASDF